MQASVARKVSPDGGRRQTGGGGGGRAQMKGWTATELEVDDVVLVVALVVACDLCAMHLRQKKGERSARGNDGSGGGGGGEGKAKAKKNRRRQQ